METKISLREWAKENKIWEVKTWRTFLEKDLIPFYKQAYTLNALYEFLKSKEICGKPSLSAIEDGTLKGKIRVAIYGGVEPNKDFNKSFAKFMYDNFGICAEKALSFEESIKYYESWGDDIKVSINSNSWINSIPIKSLVDKLRELIQRNFCRELGIKLSEIGIQESSPYPPLEVIEIDTLLPQAGERPEKLVSLINDFRQKALDLSIGVNPFTTFVFYSRAIPLSRLMRFLECDIDKATKLADFLGLVAYSMIDCERISLLPENLDEIILNFHPADNLLAQKILELQYFLQKIEPTIREIYKNMIKEAINQIHISFEPWEDYKPIFSLLADALSNSEKVYVRYSVQREQLTVLTIKGYYYGKEIYSLKKPISIYRFWEKFSPAICGGILDWRINEFELLPHTKEWIDKVIKSEGKT